MKVKIKKNWLVIMIYLIASIIFLVPVLEYGADIRAVGGFWIGLIIVIVTRRKFFSILCYFLIILFNIHMSYVPIGYGNMTLLGAIKIIIIMSFISLIIKTKGLRKYLINRNILYYFIWCFACIMIYVINALYFNSGLGEMLFRLVPIYFSIYLICIIYDNNNLINELLIVIVVAAILYSIVAYIELLQGKTFFYSSWTGMERYRHGIMRVGSTLEDANVLALYLLPPIFILMMKRTQILFGKVFSKILIVLMAIVLYITSSRASLFSLAVGILLIFILNKKSLKQLLLIVFAILGVMSIPFVIKSLNTYEAASAGQRFYIISKAIILWKSHFLFGIGVTEFQKQTAWLTMCEYVRQLCEVGIFAFIIYCGFFVLLIRIYYKNSKTLKSDDLFDASCILGLIVAFMINSISLDTFFYYIMWLFPVLLFYFLKLYNNSDY